MAQEQAPETGKNHPTPPASAAALQQVRDRLAGYLSALDKDKETARNWLHHHEDAITIGYHWLDRAFTLKMQKEARQIIDSLGNTAGFVLSLQDFGARAEKTFGAQSKIAQEIAQHKDRLPQDIFTSGAPPALPKIPETLLLHLPPPATAPEKKWWAPKTWFSKDEPALPSPQAVEEQARWKMLRDEITAMQSDDHHYVDSFMDWVGDTLAPDGKAPDDAAMDSYKDPQHIAALAKADQKAHIAQMAEDVAGRARLYARLAAALDEQRIDEFAAILPALFPKKDTSATLHLKKLFLEDYRAASFAEIALKQVVRRDDQLLLFKTALEFEPGIAFKGARTRREILDRIRDEVEAKRNPLDREALRLARRKLDAIEREEEKLRAAQRRASRVPEEDSLSDLFNRALSGLEKMLGKALAPEPPPARPRPRSPRP